MENYIKTLAQNLPLDYLVSIIIQIPPIKHLEYAIKINNKDLVLLIIDNMDISIKNVEVDEYGTKKMVSKNFYDDSDILLQLFNYDYELYCRLIHRCNDNMIPIKLTLIFYGEEKDNVQPSFSLGDNMKMVIPVFDNLRFSENMMGYLYDAINGYFDDIETNNYIFSQTIRLFEKQFIDFLNECKHYDCYLDRYLPRTMEILTALRIKKKLNDNIKEYILTKILDGTLIIPKFLIYCEVMQFISETNMYYIVMKYKPESTIPIQDIFNWYCYKNSPYCQYIVKHYKVDIPTFDTFLRCYHKVHYYYDEDKDDDYYNKKVSKILEPVKKYLCSLGGDINVSQLLFI